MHIFFGGKKKAPAPKKDVGESAAETIKTLRSALDTLDKKKQYLDTQIEDQTEKVLEKVRGKDISGAKMALVRKNAMVKQREMLHNQIMALEKSVMSLDTTATTDIAVRAMEAALKASREIAAQVGAPKVGELFEDLEEMDEQANEIADLFSQNAARIGGEGDLDEELNALQAQLLDEDLMKARKASVPAIAGGAPPVPVGPVAVVPMPERGNADEERELAELKSQLQFA